MEAVMLRRFESPDETRKFEKGVFELVHVGGMTVGRARYEPGWRWSTHVGPSAGTRSCQVAHVGLVASGRAKVLMDDGREVDLAPGDRPAASTRHRGRAVGVSMRLRRRTVTP